MRLGPLHDRGALPAAAGGLPRARRRAGRRPARAGRRAHRAGQRPRREPRAGVRRPVRRDVRAWVAPYIGDLVGYRTLHGVVPQVASPRADVANTIRYRRRKGTVSVLEQLARDVTGWPAHAVEFFELLATTQYMNHIRPQAPATADLRSAARLELAGAFQAGAFDGFAHTARDAAHLDSLRALQHPERRHLPLARAVAAARAPRRSSTPTAPACASASTSSGRTSRCSRPATETRSRTSPSRSTCRCRCCAASRGEPRRALRRRARRCCSRPRPRAASTRSPPPTSASATSPTTRRRRERGRTSRSPPTRTWRSIRCSAASPFPPRRAPARRGSRPSTTGRRSRSAAAATTGRDAGEDRAPSSTVSGGDPLGPPLARSQAAAECRSSTAAVRAPHDHRDDAAANGRPPSCSARRTAHGRSSRAPTSSARDGSRHDRRPERARARRRAARDRGVGGHRAAQPRAPPLHARARASRATPTAHRSRSAARASSCCTRSRSVTLDHASSAPSWPSRAPRSPPTTRCIEPACEDEVAYCGRARRGGGPVTSRGRPRDRRRPRRGRTPDARELHRVRQDPRGAARRLELAAPRRARRRR